MASKGIGVPFVADVGPFLKGTKSIEGALDDVGDSLDDLNRDAQASTAKVASAFKDTAHAADSAGDKITSSFKDTFRDVKQAATRAGGDTGSALGHEFTKDLRKEGHLSGKEAGKEIGGEFAQNIGEGISGGATGVDGAINTLLGTAGGVLPALGPLGAVAGIGALVVSSIVGGISASKAAAVKAAHDFGNDVTDALRDGVLDSTERENIVTKALGVDSLNDALPIIANFAQQTGRTVGQVFDDIASGNTSAIAQLNAFADATATTQTITVARGATVVKKSYTEAGKAAHDLAAAIGLSNDALRTGQQNAATYNATVNAGVKAWDNVGKAAANAIRTANNAAKLSDRRFLTP